MNQADRLDANILSSIWQDITQASFVVADITNLNPNAVLELAMAQAFGCRTLILTQNKEPHAYFAPISKVRTHHYNLQSGDNDLTELLERFLNGEE